MHVVNLFLFFQPKRDLEPMWCVSDGAVTVFLLSMLENNIVNLHVNLQIESFNVLPVRANTQKKNRKKWNRNKTHKLIEHKRSADNWHADECHLYTNKLNKLYKQSRITQTHAVCSIFIMFNMWLTAYAVLKVGHEEICFTPTTENKNKKKKNVSGMCLFCSYEFRRWDPTVAA